MGNTSTHQKQTIKSESDTKTISKCNHMDRLIAVMKQYNTAMNNLNKDALPDIDSLNITETLDDYLHLLHNNDTDEDFDDIFNKLEDTCNINECVIFRRYSKNIDTLFNKMNTVAMQVMDKIHCYYCHSYDIGHRLSHNERKIITNIDDDEKTDIDSDTFLGQMRSATTSRFRKIMSNKHKPQRTTTSRFNSLDDNNYKIWDGGELFNYNSEADCDLPDYMDSTIFIKPVYKSLKDELINNKIATLNIHQFDNEYKKASLHLNSAYCRDYITNTYCDEDYGYNEQENTETFAVHHALALMVYCNYDNLQCQFSKTYRDRTNSFNDNRHSQFFYLGKYLACAVLKFGIMSANAADTLFHGISGYLVMYVYHIDSMVIHSALSTTPSFAVAVNFAQKGIVLQFNSDTGSGGKCFQCSWISDYPNEKECLFVQAHGFFELINTFDVQLEIEYRPILRAMLVLDAIFNYGGRLDQEIYSNIMGESEFIHFNKDLFLCKCIIQHQLSPFFPNICKAFKSLNDYGRGMINGYFRSHCDLKINYLTIDDQRLSFLKQLLFKSQFGGYIVRLDVLTQLFARRLRSVHLENMEVSEVTLDGIFLILNHLRLKSNKMELEEIWLGYTNEKGKSETEQIKLFFESLVNQYYDPFIMLEYEISLNVKDNWKIGLHIVKFDTNESLSGSDGELKPKYARHSELIGLNLGGESVERKQDMELFNENDAAETQSHVTPKMKPKRMDINDDD